MKTPLHEIASKPPLVARHKLSYLECASTLASRNIWILPVVDEEGRLLSACTELDFALVLIGRTEKASSFSTEPVVLGQANDTIVEVLGFMLEKGFRRIPVLVDDTYYMATMSQLLYSVARASTPEELLDEVRNYSTPSPVLDYGRATLGDVAEIITSTPERAVLLTSAGSAKAIITERDLVRAYLYIHRGVEENSE